MSSPGGVTVGFVFYLMRAAAGIIALVKAIPMPTTPCVYAGRFICCIWPGRRSDPVNILRLKGGSFVLIRIMGFVTNLLSP
ncbi:hypothetical protein [Lonsdalea quercina]|uniref:hypothetical protein n=1 Tax=Lonsdalea quercina TaxID=71657 RepID=UPI003976F2B5